MCMKKIGLIINKNNDQIGLKSAFDNYFNKQNYTNTINLIVKLIENELYNNNLQSISFCLEKMVGSAYHESGKIALNIKTIKDVKKTENLPLLVERVLHELGHEIIHKYNQKIIQTKNNQEKYLPEYKSGSMHKLFDAVYGDDEISELAYMYYYAQSKNELNARKFEYQNTSNVLKKYAPNLKYFLSFDEKECIWQNKVLSSKDMKHYSKMFNMSITRYQSFLIKKGLNNLDELDIKNLLLSTQVFLENDTKQKLINELINCNNCEIVKQFFEFPALTINNDEAKKLKIAYGNELSNMMYQNERKDLENIK